SGSAYSCGKNLALFVTNETMYVFDSMLGRWQEYDYELPADYTTFSSYHIMDDYVLVVLRRSQGQPKNLVYSLHTHSFNQLENGVLTISVLDHGFAGYYRYDDSDNVLVVGYSALTNEFSSPSTSGLGATFATGAGSISIQSHGEHTTYAISFYQRVSDEEIRGHFYGYDTYLSSWSYETVSFIVGQEQWSQNFMAGGRFLVDIAVRNDSVYKLIIYSGITGQWSVVIEPDLTYNSATSSILCGGEALVVYDVDSTWGYSFSTGQSSMISISEPRTLFFAEGKDYCVFSRFSDSSAQMTMYIYNSQNNHWTIISGLPKGMSTTSYSISEHVFAYRSDTSPTSETVFYSSFLDMHETLNFPEGNSVSINAKYSLACAYSSAKSYLFDAQRGQLYTFDFDLGMYSLGDFAACFLNTAATTTTLYGYSALSGKFTNLTITDTVYSLPTKGFIGLISNDYPYSKYYAFNGLKDSWVELLPSGTYKQSPVIGDKTALIVRSDRVYALDPNGRIGIYNYLIEYEGTFYPVSISTNSTTISNFSFNQSKKEISFNVTGDNGTLGFCNVTLPNTLVQNLWHGDFTILVDGHPPTEISIVPDETYTYVYFTYTHSEHEVTIIPEFPFVTILPLLIGTTFMAIIKSRSRPKNTRVSITYCTLCSVVTDKRK
ncbi:MAG: hypothetical protein QXR42_09555, partial [Candidatus Bathyarchaeia archaeon]